MFKFGKKLLGILIVSVLLISMVTATAYAVSTPKSVDKKDNEIVKIESKEKTTKYKITWNGNGGKIGTKKSTITYVKKGSKINKLAKSPKRSGFAFKGWYTKKSGGTKITKSTKPKRSATLYAQWSKKPSSRALNAEEKKLSGKYAKGGSTMGSWNYHTYNTEIWRDGTTSFQRHEFNSDGTYQMHQYASSDGVYWKVTGNWRIATKGTVSLTNLLYDSYYNAGKTPRKLNEKGDNMYYKYVFTEKDGKKGIELIDGKLDYNWGFFEKR